MDFVDTDQQLRTNVSRLQLHGEPGAIARRRSIRSVRLPMVLQERLGAVLFAAVVVAPALIYLTYLLVFATPRYVSEFRVIVRGAGQSTDMGLPQMAGLGLSLQSNDNSYAVIQYLKSQPAALSLNTDVGLRRIYSAPAVDVFSRLSARASNVEFTRYWDRRLDAYFENTTNTVIVKVEAFDPRSANRIANSTLRLSEQLVNDMSSRSRHDLVAFAQRAVDDADARLRAADAKLYQVRNQRGLIDPTQTAVAELQRQSRVQEEIAATQVEIGARRAYQLPQSPVMQALARRQAALRATLASIKSEAVTKGQGAPETLAGSINVFEQLQAQEVFAQKQYQFALAKLESAQEENSRQHLYLDTIVPPTMPDKPNFPDPAKQMLLFLIFAGAVWAALTAVLKSLRERL